MKTLKFLMLPLILLLSIYIGFNYLYSSSENFVESELTLKEAVTIGLDRARAWNDNASLLSITSVDEKLGGSRGENGKRYNWTLTFMIPNTDKHLLIGISKGIITEVHPLIGPKNLETITLDDIQFDSSSLLEVAKNKYNLQQGENWATGYHFVLSITDNKPTIAIVGTDKKKQFTKIYFDPRNAEITDAIHKIPEGGGLIKLGLGTNFPITLKKSMALKGISSGNNVLVVWGDRNPREFNSIVEPFIETSNSKADSWSPVDFNQIISNAWFTHQNELYVATPTEIWTIITEENKKNRILALETTIESLDYSLNNNIAVLSDHYIYNTVDNGLHWEKTAEPEPTLSVQIDDSGRLMLFTKYRKIYSKSGQKWNEIQIPPIKERLIDVKLLSNNLVFVTSSELLIKNLIDNKLDRVHIDDLNSSLIKKGTDLYAINDIGVIYKISKGGDEWKVDKLFEAKEGIGSATDLVIEQNNLLIATVPEYYWTKFK